jgi:hypothetical protein
MRHETIENDKSDFVIFDEEKSREIIIDLIQAKPGRIAEDIVRELEKRKIMARKKFFRILRDLKKENIIKVEEGLKPKIKNAKAARDKKLVVNESNPITVTLNELERFEKLYYLILERTTDVFNKKKRMQCVLWTKP